MGKENNDAVTNKTPRLTFSVSKEFAHLVEEVESLPNKSRFVCEAIQEKFDRMKNPGKDIAQALENFMQIQSIISQPMQQPTQQTVQGDGLKSFQTPPSSPPLDTQESKEILNHETSVVSSEIEDEEEVTPLSIVEETSKVVEEDKVEIVNPISKEDKTITNDKVNELSSEPVLTEAEKIKQEARAKYFNKG